MPYASPIAAVRSGQRPRRGGEYHFRVEDTGVGINDEDLARVGEPFSRPALRMTVVMAGPAWGLSIVKGLVRLHGGEISIRSRLGEGTRVTVRLPLDCERVGLGKRALPTGRRGDENLADKTAAHPANAVAREFCRRGPALR